MAQSEDQLIEEFLEARRHQWLSGAKPACELFLRRAAEGGKLDEVLGIRPPIAVLTHLSQAAWTRVFTDAPVRVIVVDPSRMGGTDTLAGVVAHEFGHAFHGHKGAMTEQNEYEAD